MKLIIFLVFVIINRYYITHMMYVTTCITKITRNKSVCNRFVVSKHINRVINIYFFNYESLDEIE